MVFCIYYYYHELVKERVGANPPRQIDNTKRRAANCTRNVATLSTALRGVFLLFCYQVATFLKNSILPKSWDGLLHQVRIVVILAVTFLIPQVNQAATTRLFPRTYDLCGTCTHVLENDPACSMIPEILLRCVKPRNHI